MPAIFNPGKEPKPESTLKGTPLNTVKGRANFLAREMIKITDNRGEDYGHREPNMEEFEHILGALVSPINGLPSSNACLFAEKMARWKHKPKLDTAVDMLNYLAFWLSEEVEIFEELQLMLDEKDRSDFLKAE